MVGGRSLAESFGEVDAVAMEQVIVFAFELAWTA